MVDRHVAIVGSERTPLPGSIAIARASAKTTIEVTLKLRRKQPLIVTGRPKTVLTREQLCNTYGASQDDINNVIRAFGTVGLHPVKAKRETRAVRLHGTVAAMEEAFQVTLFDYKHESGNYRGRVGPVHVPGNMKDIVRGIFGLDDRRIVQGRREPVLDSDRATSSPVPRSWYVPRKLSSHYNFPSGDGRGQTIGLLEFDGGYFRSDLATFCTKSKLPKLPLVTPVSTDGTRTNRRDSGVYEVMLDVETVAGLCPKAKIVVYFSHWSDQGWITGLDYAVHDQTRDPRVLSISYGAAEDTHFWTPQALSQINDTLRDAAMLGITVCVAAGDDGSSDGVQDGYAHVNFPASSPYVLSVGGTTILAKNAQKRDIVWKNGNGVRRQNGGNGGSTGGGVSAVFPRPKWQKKLKINSVNPGALRGRCIPDLAANANNEESPYLTVVNGKVRADGGTSAACPLIAALFTIINASRAVDKPVGYVTPVLYRMKGAKKVTRGAVGCTDVLCGNNNTDKIGGYVAGPGYDAVSGWGTPDGVKLAQIL
jgi:kumamolisin